MKVYSVNLLVIALLVKASVSFSQKAKQEIVYNATSKNIKPALFANLGETCTTPDGMAIDGKGHLYLAITNPTSFEKNGAKILTFDENDKPITWFDQLPLHPVTKRVHPMGMEFGPDGNLYLMDNQIFAGKPNESRLIRVVVENGKPKLAEALASGFNFGEAVRWYKNRVYITDALGETQRLSNIYSFTLEELNKGNIVLTKEVRAKHLISEFTLKETASKNTIGIDGIAIDKLGNLYAGNFGDGVITKIEFNAEGAVVSKKIVFDSDQLKCCDGFFYDKSRNSIFIANYENNSVLQLDLTTNTITPIWENGDANGSDGLLDNPCETIIYKGKLIVVNFDTFPGEINKEADSFHTMSVFKL